MNRRDFLTGTAASLALVAVRAPAVLSADGAERPRDRPWYSPLTPREAQLAELVTAGLTNSQMAAHLGITPWTMDHRVQMILMKLDAHRRAHISDWVVKHRPQR